MSLPPPIPWEEAQAQLLADVVPMPSESMPLADAIGRHLAAPLTARRTQPPADLSAMDGYAVRADDLAGPWQVVGESAAGHPFGASLRAGEAVRISTGAILPEGAGAVLLQEDAVRAGATLARSGEDGPEPRHIRRRGFDFAEGQEVLAAGTVLNPARIALALSAGHGAATVHRLPHIAVIDSGDELTADPARAAAHQIPASNGAMLAAMVAPLARVRRIGPVADNMAALADAFAAAERAEVIVTSGGASVGDHDLVRPALEAWGATIDFWRIAMKPGKPLLLARKGGTRIIGLPGNPVSSHVTAFLFLLPLLRALGGAAQALPRNITLPLDGNLRPIGHRAEFVRAHFTPDGIAPLAEQDSSGLFALARADALIARPIGAPAAARGEAVRVFPLENGSIA